jgi:hypothetical protein
MRNDFDIHNWQAKHLKKTSLNEELTSTTVALQVKRHLEAILDLIEQYKEENQLASNESGFDDVETNIEDTLLILGHIE